MVNFAERPTASDMLGKQTKPCDQVAAAAMWEASHFVSYEAGMWGEKYCCV